MTISSRNEEELFIKVKEFISELIEAGLNPSINYFINMVEKENELDVIYNATININCQ